MTREESLQGLAEVLMMAAEKARQLSSTVAGDSKISPETVIAFRLVEIATDLRALAAPQGTDEVAV